MLFRSTCCRTARLSTKTVTSSGRGCANQLNQPPFPAVCWRRTVFAAGMAMPKAAVDEDHGFVFRQYHVRPPRKFLSMKTEAEAHSMQQRADAHFGRGVLAANAAHIPASPFRC